MRKASWVAVLGMAVAAAVVVVPGAHADTFQLTADHCTGGCNPGAPGTSMGTVTLNQLTANDVQFVVTLVSPLKFVNTGLQNTFDFNIAGAPTISLGSISNSNFSLTSGTAGALQFDGFGDFQYSLQLNTGQGAGGSQFGPLTFVIHSASALSVANFETNGPGANVFFGVDVYNTANGNTGPIGSGGGTSVPEPSLLSMLGVGVVGLLGVGLTRKQVLS